MTLYTAHTGIKPYYFPCRSRLFHAPLSHPPSTPTPTHTHYPRPQLGLPHTPDDEWVSGGEGKGGRERKRSGSERVHSLASTTTLNWSILRHFNPQFLRLPRLSPPPSHLHVDDHRRPIRRRLLLLAVLCATM